MVFANAKIDDGFVAMCETEELEPYLDDMKKGILKYTKPIIDFEKRIERWYKITKR